jgi:hypothetical protein
MDGPCLLLTVRKQEGVRVHAPHHQSQPFVPWRRKEIRRRICRISYPTGETEDLSLTSFFAQRLCQQILVSYC